MTTPRSVDQQPVRWQYSFDDNDESLALFAGRLQILGSPTGLVSAGVLNIDASGNVFIAGGGGGGAPHAPQFSVQINDPLGSFGSDASFTYTPVADGGPFVAIGVATDFNSALLVDSANAGTFTLHVTDSAGTSRSRIETTFEVLKHSAFGSVGTIDPSAGLNYKSVVATNDFPSGDIPLNSVCVLGYSEFDVKGPTLSNMTGVIGLPILKGTSSGNAAILTGVFGNPINRATVVHLQSIVGGNFFAQNEQAGCTVTQDITGVEAIASNFSTVAGVLPKMQGLVAQVENPGSQPVTNAWAILVGTTSDPNHTIVKNYGIFIQDQSAVDTSSWNIWSDGTGKNHFEGGVEVGTAANLISTTVGLTNHAAAQAATLTNGPTAGNPAKWIQINDNGTPSFIPVWH